MIRPRPILLCAALLLGMIPAAHAAGPGSTFLVDLPPGVGPGELTGQDNGAATNTERTLSTDGDRVAFVSDSDGLSPTDDNRQTNLFVRDRSSNETILVNVGLGGAPADGLSSDPQISADGTRVVFFSQATNLVAGLPADTRGVYLRDLTAGTTTLVSRGDGPAGTLAPSSDSPALSRDGTTVAFTTAASLDAADTNTQTDVYVRKLAAQDTILISRANGAVGAVGNQPSDAPSLTDAGNTVAFQSDATNLVGAADANGTSDVYSRTLAGQTELISARDADGTAANEFSGDPSISPGGAFVAFSSNASNLDAAVADVNNVRDVYLGGPGGTDLVSRGGGGELGTQASRGPALAFRTGDAHVLVAFESAAPEITGDATGTEQILLRDTNLGTTEVISRNGAAVSDAYSFGPAVDEDASHVGFSTFARNLGTPPGGDVSRVLLRDRSAGTTELVSRTPAGALTADLANSGLDRGRRSVSADGRYVIFESDIDALLGGLPGGFATHVFRKDLLTGAVVRVDGPDGNGGPVPDASANGASMSSDGNVVAFATSGALDPADGNGSTDVYVRDIAGATTRLASRAGGAAGAVGNTTSVDPAISGDGLRVAFESRATNLGDGDTDANRDVHVRDLLASTTTLISRADGPGGVKGSGTSEDAASNADGSVIAFESAASNLGNGDTDTAKDVHVRDVAAGTTRLASRATGAAGTQGNGSSGDVTISADGLRVAFESTATNLVPEDTGSTDDILLRDLVTASTGLVSRADGAAGAPGDDSSTDASISTDGSTVAFETIATNLGSASTTESENNVIAVRRLTDATTTLASRADGAAGARLTPTEDAANPALSGDGSCAAFESSAATLLPPGVAADFNRVFVRVLARECPFDPPETTITTGPSGTVSTPANTFAFASDEPGSSFECRVDGAAFAPCGAPVTTAALADGAHLFEARATDPAGFQDATPAQRGFTVRRAVAGDTTKPRVTKASLTRRRFRVGRKATAIAAATRRSPVGTTVRYTLSEAAAVRMVIARRASGRRVGRSCRKPTRALRKRKRCTRHVTRGTLRRAGRAGANRVAFSGRIGRRALPTGRYRLILTATDPAGNSGSAPPLIFTVVRR